MTNAKRLFVTFAETRKLRVSTVIFGSIIFPAILFAIPGPTITLKPNCTTSKKNICLGEIIEASNISARDADKLNRYCRIELKGDRSTLAAKEIELHAWAAGVIPGKIVGGQIVLTHDKNAISEKKSTGITTRKLRRGSAVKLVLKSEHMQIAREAVILMDAFPGETVDVRPQGTRKTMRARLTTGGAAEAIP